MNMDRKIVECSPARVALYKGRREPQCNAGWGCNACREKYDAVQGGDFQVSIPQHIAVKVINTRYMQALVRMLEKRGIYGGKAKAWCTQDADGEYYINFRARLK